MPEPDASPGALDTRLTLETPEGGEIDLRPAGVAVRGLAMLLDELIRWGVLGVASTALGMLGALGWGVFALVVFVVYWGYGVIFEVLGDGMTPGKRMQGLRVVHADGTPIGLPASVLRNLLLVVDLLPIGYALGVVTMMLNQRFQRLGDLAGSTLVVYSSTFVLPEVDDSVGVPAPVPLLQEDQRAIVAFAERSKGLSEARARELAEVLTPLLDCRGERAVKQIQQIAAGLRGST